MTRDQMKCAEHGHGFVGSDPRRWCFWCGYVKPPAPKKGKKS